MPNVSFEMVFPSSNGGNQSEGQPTQRIRTDYDSRSFLLYFRTNRGI
ncbi:MAG: hypothetical protein OJF50_006430 [Nitrospira sp.]|nr:hypothetical protein [Nitrospira sp.]